MNCAGIIRKMPKLPIIVPPSLYKEAVKRWGKKEADSICLPDQKVKIEK